MSERPLSPNIELKDDLGIGNILATLVADIDSGPKITIFIDPNPCRTQASPRITLGYGNAKKLRDAIDVYLRGDYMFDSQGSRSK